MIARVLVTVRQSRLSERARHDYRPVEPCQHWPMAEHVSLDALELFQYAQSSLHGRTDFQTDAPGQHPPKRCAAFQHGARAANLERDQSTPVIVATAVGDMCLGYAITLHFVLGQIDTP